MMRALGELRHVAINGGMSGQWDLIMKPWLEKAKIDVQGITTSSTSTGPLPKVCLEPGGDCIANQLAETGAIASEEPGSAQAWRDLLWAL